MPLRRCLGLPDEPCSQLTPTSRCTTHQRLKDRSRGSRQARGYDKHHDKARRELARNLPAPCGYGCGTLLTHNTPWVAAHIVDGQPEHGWIPACTTCNEQAKHTHTSKAPNVFP